MNYHSVEASVTACLSRRHEVYEGHESILYKKHLELIRFGGRVHYTTAAASNISGD
jgi:hypothetical protein